MDHVFISYVREDSEVVQRLDADLRSFGIDVWLDRDRIKPGTRWQDEIRSAIQGGAFYIACFSRPYHERVKSYMNEELVVAIQELRQRRDDMAWFIPVRLDGSDVPDKDIGAGKTLRSLQWVNLQDNWNLGIYQIVSVIQPWSSDERLLEVLTLFGLNEYQKARTILHNIDSMDVDVPPRVRNFLLYNLICTESRLAYECTDNQQRNELLKNALAHLDRWLDHGVTGAWEALNRIAKSQIQYLRDDDDVYFFLTKRSVEVKKIIAKHTSTSFIPPKHPRGKTGSCVPLGTQIDTPTGFVRVEEVREGIRVIWLYPSFPNGVST